MQRLGPVSSRADLRAAGWRRGDIDRALAEGTLIRARRDHYVDPSLPPAAIDAIRVGGVVTCLSFLQLSGVFVFSNRALHVRVPVTASRLRAPESRRARLPLTSRKVVVHWTDEHCASLATEFRQSIVDALILAVRCSSPRHAVATLDSALNTGLAAESDIRDVFAALPVRYRFLEGLVDGRAQSGPESLLRLLLRSLGCSVELQVHFPGVGFTDLLVDDWLVIEVDGQGNHGGWAAARRDRRRDLLLAARGFTTLRPTAAQVLYEPELVLAAVKRLLQDRARR